MYRMLFYVGLGSCTGGICRYLTQQYIQKNYPSSFPFGTLAVNVVGCFIIGIVYGLSLKGNFLSPQMRVLLISGFCGGYTTFSSFAYENISLIQDGEMFYTFLYIAFSIIIGFGSAYLGILLIKSI